MDHVDVKSSNILLVNDSQQNVLMSYDQKDSARNVSSMEPTKNQEDTKRVSANDILSANTLRIQTSLRENTYLYVKNIKAAKKTNIYY